MKRMADAMPGALVELLRAAPLSSGKVAFAWKMTVGPALERATSVGLDGRTIIVTVATKQWAQEVHRGSPMILRKLERYLGPGKVTSVKVHLGTPHPAQSTVHPEPGT